jgi:hypothetical protein
MLFPVVFLVKPCVTLCTGGTRIQALELDRYGGKADRRFMIVDENNR